VVFAFHFLRPLVQWRKARLLSFELWIERQRESFFCVGHQALADMSLLLAQVSAEGFGGSTDAFLVLGVAQLGAQLLKNFGVHAT
jgi:hypothetical protein